MTSPADLSSRVERALEPLDDAWKHGETESIVSEANWLYDRGIDLQSVVRELWERVPRCDYMDCIEPASLHRELCAEHAAPPDDALVKEIDHHIARRYSGTDGLCLLQRARDRITYTAQLENAVNKLQMRIAELEKIAEENRVGMNANAKTAEHLDSNLEMCHDQMHGMRRRIAELERQLRNADDMMEALRRIVQWADAYPTDIFVPPDWAKVRDALADADLSLDAVSAANMRHVVEGVGNIARAAIADAEEKK